MKSGIYAWLCVSTGERYVGYAVVLNVRKEQHLRRLRKGSHKNLKFQEAWNKYGEDGFTFEVLEQCPIDKLVERENWWIDHFQLDRNGFNIKSYGSYAYFKHGMTNTRTFKSWESMLQRCTNPNSVDYPRWGGKGVKVDPRWLKFENFYADMGERPEGKTLDRYPDKNGNYEPGNCRWATPAEQQRNVKSNIYITYKGETKLAVDWAKEIGIPIDLLRQRFHRGMKGDELFAPSYSRFKGIPGAKNRTRVDGRRLQKYTAFGKTLTITDWSKELGITRSALEQRLTKYKMPIEKALVSGALKKGKEGPRKGHTKITAFGRTQSLTAWANEFNMPVSTLKNRIFRSGLKPEDALQ